jgi:RNA polymerase sigma-70 factor (ECF subfamily)
VLDATSEHDEELLQRYLRAWETLDLATFVSLLHDDIVASMPPSPTWLRGKAAVAEFTRVLPFALLASRGLRVLPASANGQPALVFYVAGELSALHVLRFKEGRVSELHHFCDLRSFDVFGFSAQPLPRSP